MSITMLRRIPAAVLATAIVGATSLLGTMAGAAEVTATASATLPMRATDWADSVVLPRFDSSLGELRSVSLRVDARMDGTAAVENLASTPATVVSTLAGLVTVSRPTPGAAIASVEPSQTRTDSLDSFDGILDRAGPSGVIHTVSDDNTTTVSLTSPADLTLFTGASPITLPTTGVDTSVSPDGPDVDADLSTRAGASVTVTYTYLTDTRPPDAPTIDASPPAYTADTDPIVTFTAETASITECRLDRATVAGAWDVCTSPWQGDLTGSPDGAFTFLVRATDAAGNVGEAAETTFNLDREPPNQPVFTTTPTDVGRQERPTWAFTLDVGTVAQCALDGALFSACSSPYVADLTASIDGPHVFAVVAVDEAGNTSPATTSSYLLDRQPPQPPTISAAPPSPGNDPTPTWDFDMAIDAATASCSLDGAPFVSCASPFTANLTSADDGVHSVAIRNRDLAGNPSTVVTGTYQLDRVGPGAPAITNPPSPSSVIDPTWILDAEPGATIECRLDAGSWLPCVGSFTTTFGPGSDGSHVVTVRATDTAGNEGAEATTSYVLDTTPPSAPVITTAPASPSNSPDPTWTFTIESGSTATCSMDGGPWSACASPLQVDLIGAPDGPHSLSVRATDPQANVGPATTSSFVLDRAAPEAPAIIGSPASPGSASTVTWTFSAPAGTTTTCRIDAGAILPCADSITATFATDGSHLLSIVATDDAGNLSATAGASYLLDRVAPDPPTIDSAPITPARLTTPEWTFTLEGSTRGECSIDDLAWVPCTTSFSADLSAAGDGVHRFAVRSTDAAGNVGEPARDEFVLDRTPPGAPVITGGPSANSGDDTPTWTFTIEDGAIAECRLDDGPWESCADSLVADLLASPDGTHSLEVRAVDGVGNVSPPTATAYNLDRGRPDAAMFTAAPLSPGNDADPEWAFTYEPGAMAVCSLDGGEATTCDGTFLAPWLIDGLHNLVVEITDAAGNASDLAVSPYALDTWAPVAPAVTAPTTPGRDVQPDWTIDVELGSVAECSLDGGPVEACGTVFSADLAGLDGPHVLVVVARDAAGNTSPPVTSPYVLDTIAPSAPVLLHTPDLRDWTWRFSIESLSVSECSFDSGPWKPCSSPLPGGTPNRTVRFEVRSVDRAGNRSDITGTTVRPTKGTAPISPPSPTPGSVAPTSSASPPDMESGPVLASPRGAFLPRLFSRAITPQPVIPGGTLRTAIGPRFRPAEPPFGGAVAQLLQAVGEKTTIPVLVVFLVIGFIAVQNRIDRRDPKLAQAPLRQEPEYVEFK